MPPRVEIVAKSPAEPIEILEIVDDETTHGTGKTVVCGYTIGRLLARGGLSVVFEVTHPDVAEPLAMKVITDERLQHDLAASAIHTHAGNIAKLASPHVVRTFDAGRLPSGEPFVVMERLLGDDLDTHLRARGPLPVADAIGFLIQACDGLAEAHAAGIVHGDIKPGNLVIEPRPQGPCLEIIDFAPSVPRASDPDDPLVTCSPGYASPEQLGTRPDVDGRADVWALGAVLFELVTGARAFEATTLPEMLKATSRVPPSMRAQRRDVPEGLDDVVRRCLARDRELRFEGVRELRDALAALSTVPRAEVAWARRVTVRVRRPNARLRSTFFLAALGPASALVSMTLVRLVMASGLASPPVPAAWPPPVALTAPSTAETPAAPR
ncbi:MAG: serine/threonine protein kinase [Labilithrix sp.]|nr:serine/threonine protein kinase [Labilithrix sp.]